MRVVYASESLAHFGQVVADTLQSPLVVDGVVPPCDEAYIVGMYDPPYYTHTLQSTQQATRRIIHWCGSDVLSLSRPEMLPANVVHLCESGGLQRELQERGIEAGVATFPTRSFEVTPLPEGKVVSVYYGNKPLFYGDEIVRMLQELLPDVAFHTYAHGTYSPEQMHSVVDQSRVYLRLTPHDGSANSAREYMAAGRRVVGTTDLPHVQRVARDDLHGIVAKLKKALAQDEPDTEAAEFYQHFNSTERYLADLEGALCATSSAT